MKLLSFFVSVLFLGLFPYNTQNDAVLTGKVTDAATGEPLIGASIKLKRDTQLVAGTICDFNGAYRLIATPGEYTFEVSYTGYQSQKIQGVILDTKQPKILDVQLQSSVLSEVVIKDYKVNLVKEEIALAETVVSEKESRKMMKRADKAPAGSGMGAAPGESRTAKMESTRREVPVTYSDDERMAPTEPAKPALEDKVYDAITTEEPTPYPVTTGQPAPRAGLLTAGEWNDLNNWNRHWVDMLKDGEIDNFQALYGFYPKNRYSVMLTNELDYPLVDVPVTLHDRSGNPIWQARTDNNGKAELWANLYDPKGNNTELLASATVDGKEHHLGALKPFEEGLNRHMIQKACGASKNVDIVWTVDATGSMGDELEYLKTELLDVIGRVKAINPELNIRMGSVFYRDEGDDYIAKSSALTPDIAKTVDYIRQQSAGGGGDYPEAVHTALEETINNQPWSADAVARICFLVLDASPHQDPAVQESIRKTIREAARKGIRVVPVSASGIQKDTEFLMKFFGLATNGSYVFLTDHSGIGGKHLEPTTDEYTVEALNDLLVRIITEYSTVESCEGKTAIRFEDPQQQQQNNPQQALYYPNPAVNQFTLELPFDAAKVTLYNAEGKSVRNFAKLEAGVHSIPVHDLPPGFYTLRIWAVGQVQSGKIIVVKAT